MLAITNSKCYEILPSAPPSLELIVNRIVLTPIIYCLVYIPPKSLDEYLQESRPLNFLTNYKKITDNLILLN